MSERRSDSLVHAYAFTAFALSVLSAGTLQAQSAPPADSGRSRAFAPSLISRISVSARYGVFRPAGKSEAFTLIDRALAPGSGALQPTLVGGDIRVAVTPRWRVVFGAEAGKRTVNSVSQVLPTASVTEVQQRTTFDLTSVQYAGVEWQALRWRGATHNSIDHLRLMLGGGAGTAHYQFHQWGDFVDAERRVAYPDDFESTGHGNFGYASVGLDVPLRGWLALQGEMRRQFGSAPMNADYSTFDHLDLGGTRIGVGMLVRPTFKKTR